MKKIRRRLATILAMVMVITSFTFLGVYADPTDPSAGSTDVTQTEGEGEGEDVGVEAPAAVTGLAAYASSNAVVLLWDKVDDDTVKYLVNGNEITPTTYKNKNRYDIGNLGEGQSATGTVVAYRMDGDQKIKSAERSATSSAVRTIRYRVRIKKGGTLKSHGGPRQSIYVRKGEYIDCYGFGGGKYIFERNGSIFYCNKSRTNKRSCVWMNVWNYSRQEAEFFVNARGISSNTRTLIWVNTYTQHLYMFSGSAGQWTCFADFDCSTGKAATPSPTGVSGQKAIWKKISKRHGIRYWSPYSDINSIHAKKKKWKIGHPSSNGCIRNYEENAYNVYVNAPIGTKVLLY